MKRVVSIPTWNHIFVLIPVFCFSKHSWINSAVFLADSLSTRLKTLTCLFSKVWSNCTSGSSVQQSRIRLSYFASFLHCYNADMNKISCSSQRLAQVVCDYDVALNALLLDLPILSVNKYSICHENPLLIVSSHQCFIF